MHPPRAIAAYSPAVTHQHRSHEPGDHPCHSRNPAWQRPPSRRRCHSQSRDRATAKRRTSRGCRRWIRPTSTSSTATSPIASGYVTLLANYIPLQQPYGGPNYFAMDPSALYEIHVDNDGDAKENLTFQFRFTTASATTTAASSSTSPARRWRSRSRTSASVSAADNSEAQLPRKLPGDAGARRSPPRQCGAGHQRQRRHGVRQAL